MSELDDFVSEDDELDNVEMTSESQPDEALAEVEETELNSDETVVDNGEPTSPDPEAEDEPESEPVIAEKHEQQMIPLAAKQAEKERRLRAEAELAELRAAQNAKPEPDAYIEPDKAIKHEVQKLRQEMQFERNTQSEMRAREKYDDFDQKMEIFTEMVAAQPQLIGEMSKNFDPGEYVYQTAKHYQSLKEIGDPDSYKETLREQLRTELMAEMNAPQQNTRPVVNSPPDLSTVRSSGSDPDTEIADGTEGLNQLLGR